MQAGQIESLEMIRVCVDGKFEKIFFSFFCSVEAEITDKYPQIGVDVKAWLTVLEI